MSILMLLASISIPADANVTKQAYGKMPDGTPVDMYVVTDGNIEARIITYGAALASLRVPDRKGDPGDIILGYDTLEGYTQKTNPYFGAIVGRYANRIAHGQFSLDGKTYALPKNDGDNTLHGGPRGFDKIVWSAKAIVNGVELMYISKDGDEGFPGTLTATVRYTLQNKVLRIDYMATTDKNTVVNLSNHAYYNLSGAPDILGHELKLNASAYTPIDAALIPTGELAAVAGTPFDFRNATAIGARINDKNEQLTRAKGYDHNWVLDKSNKPGTLEVAAELYDKNTGRVLQIWTDQPGIQFYSGNFLDGTLGGKGKTYAYRSGLCLETQHFPDSPNHPGFPSTELKRGETYKTSTELHFSVR